MILVDIRTGSVELLSYLPGSSARAAQLDFGDACFTGMGSDGAVVIGIERKTVSDLIRSIRTGRWQGHQLPGLLSSYNFIYLVVEGMTRVRDGSLSVFEGGQWRHAGFTAHQWDSMINTVQVVAGVMVRTTPTIRSTADLILTLYKWWQKDWAKHKSHIGFSVTPRPACVLTMPSLVVRMAKELPGIGWERAAAVGRRFSSVGEMVNAEVGQWCEIPGIGHKIAAQIKEVLNNEAKRRSDKD